MRIDQWRADAASGRLRRGVRLRHRGGGHADRQRSRRRRGDFTIGTGGPGQTDRALRDALVAIQRGAAPDPHGWLDRLD